MLRTRSTAHAFGLVVAALLAALVVWLAWRGYRQPELLIDFANMRVC